MLLFESLVYGCKQFINDWRMKNEKNIGKQINKVVEF